MKQLKNPVLLLKAIIFIVPVAVCGWLVFEYTAFFGTLHLQYDFEQETKALSGFYPAGRALDRSKNLRTKEASQTIIAEPVYFDVDVPRSFDGVDVTIEYKESQQPFMEFGVITNRDPWLTKLYPLKVNAIDEAARTWYRTADADGTILLQRNRSFESVSDFLNAVPTNEGVGTYRYTLPASYQDSSYSPQAQGVTVDRALRGPHEFATYIKEEILTLTLAVQDTNMELNDDSVTIQVTRDGTLVYEESLPDDGVIDATGVTSDVRTVALSIPDLAEGVYSIRVNTTNDVVIAHLETAQHRFVVKNRITLAAQSDSTTLFFQGALLSASTTHAESAQTLQVANENFFVHKAEQFFWWERKPEEPINTVREMIIPENDILLSTKGFFSFTQDSFFDPNYLIQDVDETTRLDDIDYIIYRDYTQAQEEARAFTQVVPIGFDSIAGDRKHLTFLLSAPGMDRIHASMQINHIRFDFHREPLYKRILDRFKSL